MVVVQYCWQLLEGRSQKELTLVGTLCIKCVDSLMFAYTTAYTPSSPSSHPFPLPPFPPTPSLSHHSLPPLPSPSSHSTLLVDHYGRAVIMFGIPYVYTQSRILKVRHMTRT